MFGCSVTQTNKLHHIRYSDIAANKLFNWQIMVIHWCPVQFSSKQTNVLTFGCRCVVHVHGGPFIKKTVPTVVNTPQVTF